MDDQYDHGPVILQKSCPVLDSDDASSLQRRVFDLECELLPESIRLLASKKVRFSGDGRRVTFGDD